MPLCGNTESFSLSDLIQVLAANQYSGTLKITNQDTTKIILLKKGEVKLLSWPQNKNIRIGSILVKQQKITEDQLEEALKAQKNSSKKLGELLIDKGYLTEEEIHQAVKAKLEEEIYEIFTWENSYFEFTRNEYPPEFGQGSSITALSFNPHNLLMEGMRRSDEWKLLREKIPSDQVIFEKSGPLPESFSEDEKILEMCELIDGKTKIPQLVERSKQGKFEVYSSLNLLLQNQVITPLTFAQCQQAFYDSLNEKDFAQAITFLEAAFRTSQESGEIKNRLCNSLLSHKEFIVHDGPFRLSLHLEKEALAVLITSLFLKKHYGSLLISTENRKKYIILSEEEIHIYDTAPQDHLRLGQVLVRQGKINRSDVDYCITKNKLERRGLPLGELLQQEGLITQDELHEALREKILEDLAEILLWSGTYLSFQKNTFTPPQEKATHYSSSMTGELHRRIIENISRWEDLITRVSHMRNIFTQAQHTGSQTLDGKSSQFLDFINGQRSVQDLSQLTHQSQMDLCQTLYRLLNKGYIRNYTPAELEGKIEEALATKNPHQAIKFCRSAYEQTRDQRFVERQNQIQQKDNILLAHNQNFKLEGDFFTFPMLDLFQVFSQNYHTGTFTLQSGSMKKTIFFREGNLTVLYLKNPEKAMDLTDELEFYLPEEDQVINDLLETFHWKNARFQYTSNYLPEYYYSPAAQDHLWQFETQLLMMESIKQVEGFEFLCSSIPTLDVILAPGENGQPFDEETQKILDFTHKLPTVLEIYKALHGRDISQFVLKLEELVDEGALKVWPGTEARRKLEEEDWEDLDEALKLCHHIEVVEEDPQVEDTIQSIMKSFSQDQNTDETLGERKLHRKEFALLMEKILAKDSSGTLILLTSLGQYAVYLSREELWLYPLEGTPDLQSAIFQVTGQRKTSLKEALYYAEKKNISLGAALAQAQVFAPAEVTKVMINKITTDLLQLASLPDGKMAYHPAFFSLSARANLPRALSVTGNFEALLNDMIGLLSHPDLTETPLVDGLLFEIPEKAFHITERVRSVEKSRRKLPKTSFVGERDLRKLLDGKNTVGDITAKTKLEKITVWKLLLNLLKLGEIALISAKTARKQGQNAYMANNFELAQKYYEYALFLEPADEKLQKELDRILRFAGKAGRL